MIKYLALFLFFVYSSLYAQKEVYIPGYLRNPYDANGQQFTWDKTAQSANFTLIWGNTVGTNPNNAADPNLRFDPTSTLNTLEWIYGQFKNLGLLNDDVGTSIARFKVPVVIYNTWGDNGSKGWANGGSIDYTIGAFWIHPLALRDGGIMAHEFTHSLQSQINMDLRDKNGLGTAFERVGIFYETHANFMRNLIYPQFVTTWGMDYYHSDIWNSWKKNYESFHPLFGVYEADGVNMVNRLFRESYNWEYPYQTYKRLKGLNQSEFNDGWFQIMRRMVTMDFPSHSWGNYLRSSRANGLNSNDLQLYTSLYTIPKKVSSNFYQVIPEQAPEEYAYTIIPIYPTTTDRSVLLNFIGNSDYNEHTGWRYSFVTQKSDGTISRYGPIMGSDYSGPFSFQMNSDEERLFLFVMGAPKTNSTLSPNHDTWQGYPKIFRFPFGFYLTGGVPEGYQSKTQFRSQLKSGGGSYHINGGGWVANTCSVASSVYVGPHAIVTNWSNLSGNVRIENTSIVSNSTLSGNAKVLNNALVRDSQLSENATIQGEAIVTNCRISGSAIVGMRANVSNYTLSGSAEVGGDVLVYNSSGNSDKGVHLRMTNYYQDNVLENDGRSLDHPQNSDVNFKELPDAFRLSYKHKHISFINIHGVSILSPGSIRINANTVKKSSDVSGFSTSRIRPGFHLCDASGKTFKVLKVLHTSPFIHLELAEVLNPTVTPTISLGQASVYLPSLTMLSTHWHPSLYNQIPERLTEQLNNAFDSWFLTLPDKQGITQNIHFNYSLKDDDWILNVDLNGVAGGITLDLPTEHEGILGKSYRINKLDNSGNEIRFSESILGKEGTSYFNQITSPGTWDIYFDGRIWRSR